MRFVAIDVETACSAIDSICQIGICIFQDGREIGCYESIVNPECGFDRINISIHGITERDVAGAPTFGSVIGPVNACLRGGIVVSHSHFDRNALAAAYARVDRSLPDCMWLDSIALAKRAWPDQAGNGGYKLSVLAKRLGIDFQHHDALEDARTAGRIAIAALSRMNVPLEDAVRHYGRPVGGEAVATRSARKPHDAGWSRPVTMTEFAGGSGPLAGQRIAFTGVLSVPREEAARMACAFGAACSDSISRKTTLLVIGGATGRELHDAETGRKSGKQVKVEKLIAEGVAIRVMSETAFRALCEACHGER